MTDELKEAVERIRAAMPDDPGQVYLSGDGRFGGVMVDDLRLVLAAVSRPSTDGEGELPDELPGHWTTPEGLQKAREYATKTRADLMMGDLPDLVLANAVFLVDRFDLQLIHFQTAAKERIRWLSVQLALANERLAAVPRPSEPAGDGEGVKGLAREIVGSVWDAENMPTFANNARCGAGDDQPIMKAVLSALSPRASSPSREEVPWCDLKIAFDIDHDEPLWGAWNAKTLTLPAGWELDETCSSGAAGYVAVFRVEGQPSVDDAEAVEAELIRLGCLALFANPQEKGGSVGSRAEARTPYPSDGQVLRDGGAGEVAWLIERTDLAPGVTHYWWERHPGNHAWTQDVHWAMRFPSREAALVAVGAASGLRVAEHKWVALPEADAPTGQPDGEARDGEAAERPNPSPTPSSQEKAGG